MSMVIDDLCPGSPPPLVWMDAPRRPMLAMGAVHLWRIRTDELGAGVKAALEHLDTRQQERAGRIRHPAHRDRYVRAQSGLRVILARYLDCRPAAIDVRYGPAGKPELAVDGATIEFNLTTTGERALVAVGPGRGAEGRIGIGIDCEWIRPRRGLDAVAARMFTPDVRDAILAIPDHTERLHAFYRAWTALEADAKADGRGLLRARAPGAQPPDVAHCIPEAGYIAAVARLGLPPVADWLAFDLRPDA